jgi:hypothetical protein
MNTTSPHPTLPTNAFEDESFDEAHPPWDPNKIRVQTKPFSLRQVVDEISDGGIDLAPDFQRGFVWRERQKCRLIESILLGIPLPAFYFNAEPDGRQQVVDGVQRLNTIFDFAKGRFRLSDLEYLGQLESKSFGELDSISPVWRRRFNQTSILVHVIEPPTPSEVKFNIFKRLNTGGTPLTPQEIRHCISRSRSRDMLRAMAASPSYARATLGALATDQHMVGRELALRFIAFRAFWNSAEFERHDTFDDFLTEVTRRIDDPKATSEEDLGRLAMEFERAMRNAAEVLGPIAFRRAKGSPLNRALFDAWAVALADLPTERVELERERILRAYTELLERDDYIKSITGNTAKTRFIELRLRAAREAVAGVAG